MSGETERPQRFGRAFRLAHRREYDAIYAGKARVERSPLVVHGIPSPTGRSRLGLAIGRRVGNAVRRGRLKRKIREAFRMERASLPAPYDVVVGARPHDDLPLATYRQQLAAAIEAIHALWMKRERRANRPSPPPDGGPGLSPPS